MLFRKHIRALCLGLGMLGMLIPSPVVQAVEPGDDGAVPPPTAIDVELAGGELAGLLTDRSGNPHADAWVQLYRDGNMIDAQRTGGEGEFSFRIENGGMLQLAAGDHMQFVRCWSEDTAPPKSVARVLVATDHVYRGQIHPAACGFGNPWVITGIAVAAIVIPVAIHNNRNDRPAASE